MSTFSSSSKPLDNSVVDPDNRQHDQQIREQPAKYTREEDVRPISSAKLDSAAGNPVMDRVNSLRQQLAGLVTLEEESKPVIRWGCPELDQFMPGGELQPGMIMELLYQQRGGGAGALAMHLAKQAVNELQAPLVVVDRARHFYPPAAVARGVEPRNLVIVRPPESNGMSAAEELWAIDQALRCPGVAVVMAWMNKIDPNAYRRLQLAAEAGKTLALLIRPENAQAFPTWADIQLLISPQALPPTSPDRRQMLSTRRIARQEQTRPYERPLMATDTSPAAQPARQHASRSTTSSGDPPWSQHRSEHRFCTVTLLRQRGRVGHHIAEGAQLQLEIDEIQGTLQVAAGNVRNEARTMHMAPRMAHSTTRRRSAGA